MQKLKNKTKNYFLVFIAEQRSEKHTAKNKATAWNNTTNVAFNYNVAMHIKHHEVILSWKHGLVAQEQNFLNFLNISIKTAISLKKIYDLTKYI